MRAKIAVDAKASIGDACSPVSERWGSAPVSSFAEFPPPLPEPPPPPELPPPPARSDIMEILSELTVFYAETITLVQKMSIMQMIVDIILFINRHLKESITSYFKKFNIS